MKLLRLEPVLIATGKEEHCLELLLTSRQAKELIRGLVDSLDCKPQAGPDEVALLKVQFYGTLKQHHEEWRALPEVPAECGPCSGGPCSEPDEE